jgi:hypothetical protein
MQNPQSWQVCVRQISIPNDEKLIAQLTSRRKLYDSKGRENSDPKQTLLPEVSSHLTALML